MSESAIYQGTVRHRRFTIRNREFVYPIAMAYVDLDELPDLLGGRLLRRMPGITRFRRRDYFGDRSRPLADEVRARVSAETGREPTGPIRLLTQLRSFGHCFNPISLYYCFGADGRLAAVLAEVTNTPWGQRTSYVLDGADSRGQVLRGTDDKTMHVSPFMPMEQRYEWRAATPGPTLSMHVDSHQGSEKVFDATLALRRRPFTRRSLASVNARFPAATLRMLALIYGHAVVMWLRRIPWHRNPTSGRPA
jgi:DUF1365 family protein